LQYVKHRAKDLGDGSRIFSTASMADLSAVKTLLQASGLLAEDLQSVMMDDFLVAKDHHGGLRACVGFERKGDVALLRSLAVASEWRAKGVGSLALAAIEKRAQARGIPMLYLLTTTAASFFERRAYLHCDRSCVPTAIQATAQFAGLCPASAVCLCKPLT
jgi:amino-acid N-acetyltransferase